MKLFFRLFCLVLAVVAATSVVVKGDGEGQQCDNPIDVDLSFSEMYNTTDAPISKLEFSPENEFEVKGIWFRVTGEDKVVRASTCGDETNFKVTAAVFIECDVSSQGFYYKYLGHSDSCSIDFFASKDEDYFVIFGGRRVNNETFKEGDMKVTFQEGTGPEEQSCIKAKEITGFPFTDKADTIASVPKMDSCQFAATSGFWYHFVGSGRNITVNTCSDDSDFDTYISVHSSCDETPETCIAYNDDFCGLRSEVTFDSTEGKDYYIFVTGSKGERGRFTFNALESGYNDHGYCTEAIEIDEIPFVYRGSTNMIPYVDSFCQEKPLRGIWFHISRVTNDLIAMTCENNDVFTDTAIDVYSDCSETQKVGTHCVKFDDDYCGLNAAVVLTQSDTGYYIFVAGLSYKEEGQNFTLTVESHKDQTNDLCWEAERVRNLPSDFSGSTEEFEHTSDSTCGLAKKDRRGAWFSYFNTGSKDRVIGVTTCNSENVMKADLEVYEECRKCLVSAVYDQSMMCSNLTFTARPSINYTIFVTATEGEEDGYYHVDFFEDAENENEKCESAEEVKSLPYYSSGFTSKSTMSYTDCDAGEQGHFWKGVWYHFKGTGRNISIATVVGSTHFDSLLEIHSSCPSSSGSDTCLAVNDDSSRQGLSSHIKFMTDSGKDYYLFVRGWKGATGMFSLIFYEDTEPSNSQCMNAEPLVPGKYGMGYTKYASPSVADCYPSPRRGIWYQMKVDKDETVILSTCDDATAFDTDIEVYDSCSDAGASGCVDHKHSYRCTPGTYIVFDAVAKKDYFIFVTGNRTDVEQGGFFRIWAMIYHAPTSSSTSPTSSATSATSATSTTSTTSTTSSTPSGSNSHTEPSDSDVDLEVVDVLLIIFSIILVGVIIFTAICCVYKRRPQKSYIQMDVPDGLDTNESSSYIPPESL